MLSFARGSAYSWLCLFGAALVAFCAIKPGHSEDYGAGMLMMAVVVGASALCFLLALLALSAYFLAWRRDQPLLLRDTFLICLSVFALAAFVWPASLLVRS